MAQQQMQWLHSKTQPLGSRESVLGAEHCGVPNLPTFGLRQPAYLFVLIRSCVRRRVRLSCS